MCGNDYTKYWLALLLAWFLLFCSISSHADEPRYYITESQLIQMENLNREQTQTIGQLKSDVLQLKTLLTASNEELTELQTRDRKWVTYSSELEKSNASKSKEILVMRGVCVGLLVTAIVSFLF
jgi:septal ring factor EnvC (AmiA/AmiB activator)